jgi:hypothetical protein
MTDLMVVFGCILAIVVLSSFAESPSSRWYWEDPFAGRRDRLSL